MLKKFLFLVFLISTTFFMNAKAQESFLSKVFAEPTGLGIWTRNGPYDVRYTDNRFSLINRHQIHSVQTNANWLFAGGNGDGVYRSLDGGSTWANVSIGLPVNSQGRVDFDPDAMAVASNGNVVYIADSIGQIYRTDNGGQNWQSVYRSGIPYTSRNPTSLAVNPSQILFFSEVFMSVSGGSQAGVYRSGNSGLDWEPVGNGLPSTTVREIRIDPNSAAILYAACSANSSLDGRGIYKTVNSGQTWVSINSGLPANASVTAIKISPSNSSVLYIGVSNGTNRVYRSGNGGLSWSPVSSGLPLSVIEDFAVSPTNSDIVYAAAYSDGIYRTTDGGQNWTAFNNGLPSPVTATGLTFGSDGSKLHLGSKGVWNIDVSNITNCSYTLSPSSIQSIPASGSASNSITVTTNAGCSSWSASTQSSWIHFTGGTSGNGNGVITFSVEANNAESRTGTILIGGQSITVSQIGNCSYSLTPLTVSPINLPSAGGVRTINVATGGSCSWAASTQTSWIHISEPSGGIGSNAVNYSFDTNTGVAPRIGSIALAGQIFTVIQTGNGVGDCAVTPINFGQVINGALSSGDCYNDGYYNDRFIFNGTQGQQISILIQTPSGTGFYPELGLVNSNAEEVAQGEYCSNAPSCDYYARIPLSGNLTLPETGTYFIGATSTYENAIGSYTLSLSSTCYYNLQSNGGTFGWTTSGQGQLLLNAPTGCAWNAASNVDWIHVSTASGSGTQPVFFNVDQVNYQGTPRTGLITINGLGGQVTYTVTQEGAPCNINGNIVLASNFPASGGTGQRRFDLPTGCNWSAASTSSWIHITNTSGNGNGIINFTVDINNGEPRSGTIGVVVSPATGNINQESFGVGQNSFTAETNRKQFDFDGDGKADISVFRPSNGAWYLQRSATGFTGTAFGQNGDKIVPADYDGDGKTDIAVYRNGIWYLQRSQLGFTGIQFGDGNDIPMPSDYDGDNKADIAVFRPSTGVWYVLPTSTGNYTYTRFGAATDKPVAADYDGDGKTDIAVFRPSTGSWYIASPDVEVSHQFITVVFGSNNDVPVPADYDGDGKADVAVFRPSNGTWYLLRSQLGFTGSAFGTATDLPTPADYDGDGKSDIAVFRPSNGYWYLQQTTTGFTGIPFGTNGDKPISNAFVQ